jgi:ubiquinone biosynthesis protein
MVSIVSAFRDLARIREVSTVLIRHGFGEVVQRIGIGGGGGKRSSDRPDEASPQAARTSVPERIRRVLEDLGPSFVKLGQLASTRADLLPPDLVAELRKLQDSVPPLPFEEVRGQIERSLGAPIEDIFLSFDETPLAAASIAQVHRARLRDENGEHDVAVKVQRPGIATTIASDLDILHTLAALLERAIPETRIYSPIGLVQQFDHAVTAELDFAQEADNALRFAQNFAENPQIRFPKIYRAASSKQVITMEFLDGVKFHAAIEQGHSGRELARLAFGAMVKQIYEDGFFHADPHPGNALVLGPPGAPVLAMFDLGMVGRLSPRMRDLTIDVVMSALRRDYEGIASALYQIGSPSKKIDMAAYQAEVATLADRYLGRQLRDIEMSGLIRDLVRAATKYGIEIPTDFVLMGKALMTIEGVGKEIDPTFDVYEEARPLFTELLKKRYSPERMGNELLRRIERLGGASYRVPQQLEEVLDDLRLGRLRIQMEDKQATRVADRAGRRSFAGMIVGVCLLSSAVLFALARDVPGYVFLGAALVSVLGHLAAEAFRDLRYRG